MKIDVQLIGIIGAGQMGLGIAQVLATSELDVIIHDNDENVHSTATKVLEKSLIRAVNKGKLEKVKASDVLKRIFFRPHII